MFYLVQDGKLEVAGLLEQGERVVDYETDVHVGGNE